MHALHLRTDSIVRSQVQVKDLLSSCPQLLSVIRMPSYKHFVLSFSCIRLFVFIFYVKLDRKISLFRRQTLNTVRRTVNALNYQKSRSLACISDERNCTSSGSLPNARFR